MKELSYYQDIVAEDIANDKDRTELFEKIDAIEACDFTLPDEVSSLPGMRTVVSTGPHDSLMAACRALASVLPYFELQPLSPMEPEVQRMEAIESFLEWHFWKANRRGARYPLWDIVFSALKYQTVAMQIEYLPHTLKDRTDPRAKYLMSCGDFVPLIHSPRNVHPRYDDYGPQSVSLAQLMTVLDIIEKFGKDNLGVKKLMKKVENDKEKSGIGFRKTLVTFYDHCNWTDRVQWVSIGDQLDETGGGESAIELRREEHELPFFPWVYRTGDNPLLKAIVDTNKWEDLNILLSLRNWLVYRAAAHPAYATETATGEGKRIDFTDGVGELALGPGEKVQGLPPRQLDPNLSAIINETQGEISSSTVARILQTLEPAANMAFSAINALLTAALSSLAAPKRIAEMAIVDMLYHELLWMNYSKKNSFAYRRRTTLTENPYSKRGAVVRLFPEMPERELSENEFVIGDPWNIHIEVELQSNTATDKQMRVNNAQTMIAMGIPRSKAFEEMGIQNYAVLREEWQGEQLEDAAIQARAKEIIGEADLKIQQKAMAMQLQAQQNLQQGLQQGMQQEPQQQRLESPQEEAFAMAQGPGFAPGMGGEPAQNVAPGVGREQITGETWAGEELAGV